MKLIVRVPFNDCVESLSRRRVTLDSLYAEFEQCPLLDNAFDSLEIRISTIYDGLKGARAIANDRTIKAICAFDYDGDLTPDGDSAFLAFYLHKIQIAIQASPLAAPDQESLLSIVRRHEA